MSDSDKDDNFELYGTPLDPLDEDIIAKKKPFSIEDQIATDDQGRRRFHGAFTGGFSAGFFNTVGSVEGWKPSEFKSSRSEKAGKRSQKPEDFMDQEDLSEFGIAHKKLKATSDYSQSNQRKRKYQNFEGPIPGEPILYSVLEPARETVGVKLLKKMGWKPGQGIGPRVSKKEKRKTNQERSKIQKIYGCEVPINKTSDTESDNSDDDNELSFAPDDYDPYFQKPKNNIFGLGYIGLAPSTQRVQNTSQFHLTDRNNKKFSISGQAFGVGAFETEDDDIYHRDDLTNYDFELSGPEKKKRPLAQNQILLYHSAILEGFVTQSKKSISKKTYPPPEIPKSFIPKHGARISRFEPLPESHKLFDFEKKKGRHDLTHLERAKILSSIKIKAQTQKLKPDDSNTTQNKPKPTLNLDQKVQNLLDACKEQILEPNLDLKNPILGTSDSNLDSKKPREHMETSNSKDVSGLGESLGSQRSLGANPVGSTVNLGSKGPNIDWRKKLFGQSFAKGETLNDAKTPTDQIGPNESETVILQEKARKITEGLSKVECLGFKPFLADKDKQNRYETYLTLSKHGLNDRLAEIQPISMSNFEKEREISEFEQASRLFKPTHGLVFDKFISSSDSTADLDPLKSVSRSVFDHGTLEMREAAKKKMFGPLTRVVFEWAPHKLLCRRFNVPEPKGGEDLIAPTKKRNKFNVFDYYEAYQQNRSKVDEGNSQKKEDIEEIKSKVTKEERKIEEKQIIDHVIEPSTSSNTKNEAIIKEKDKLEETNIEKKEDRHEEEEVLQVPTDPKAKKDLFKSIFLSSSESEESDSEETQEDKLEEMKKLVEESVIPKKTEQPIEDKQTKKNEEISSYPMKKGFFSDLDLTKFQKPVETPAPSEEKDPSFYGPMLPKKVIPPPKVDQEWRPVFTKPKNTQKLSEKLKKSDLNKESSTSNFEVKKLDKVLKIIGYESSSSSDEWVEAGKASKKKSSKKSKKHKKHKSKHKKRKKSDSDYT